MKRHDSYRFLILIALCFLISPHPVLAAAEEDTSPPISKEVEPRTYSIAPDNCTPHANWVFTFDHTPVFQMGDLSFHPYRGMSFDSPLTTNFWQTLPQASKDHQMVSKRRCNLHLADGTKITSIRGHTKVTNHSTVVISLVARPVDISRIMRSVIGVRDSTNVCTLLIDGESAHHNPSQARYSESCNIEIDNKKNSYYLQVNLTSAPDAAGKYMTTIRTVQFDYFPPQ